MSGYFTALIILLLIIGAVLGLIVAADVRSKRSVGETDDAAGNTGSNFRQFAHRFRARARFVLSLEAEGAGPDGEVVTASTDPTLWLLVSAGVTNTTKADAGPTTMRVLVPRGCDARWTGAYSTVEPEPTTELLRVGEREVAASCLTKIVRVGPRDDLVVAVTLPVPVPADGDEAAPIPVRFRAFSDELGVGEDPMIDRVFSVRRRS